MVDEVNQMLETEGLQVEDLSLDGNCLMGMA